MAREKEASPTVQQEFYPLVPFYEDVMLLFFQELLSLVLSDIYFKFS